MMKNAFTMIELVFIIVMLGILGAIAVPKMAANRESACIVRLKGELSAIRVELKLQQTKNFLQGNPVAIPMIPTELYTRSNQCGWIPDNTARVFTPYINGNRGAPFEIVLSGGIMNFTCDVSNEYCRKIVGN